MTVQLYDLVGRDEARPFSPHCWKAAMALAHKGLDYESVPTPFTAIAEVEGGVSQTVPVIRDGERVVRDSFEIALYLEEAYPDRPSLFDGPGGEAMARFVEKWALLTVHPFIGGAALMDIYECLQERDRDYFRASREKRVGRPLEEVPIGREERRTAFQKGLEPLRQMLGQQPFIGGLGPLFADYIVFGPFQWARLVCTMPVLDDDDPVAAWVDRCLDLHDGLARRIPAAG